VNKSINNTVLKHQKLVNIDLIDSLQRLNEVSNRAASIEQMLDNALSEMLTIFGCDRVWLLHPCDPNASHFDVKMEKTLSQWSGDYAQETSVEITPAHKLGIEQCLSSPGPSVSDLRTATFAREAMEASSTKIELSVVIETRVGKPWLLGLHHCARHHNFSDDEIMVFNEMANRLAEALNSMLALKNARRSEERFRTLVEHAPEAILVLDVASNRFVDVNLNAERLFGRSRAELVENNFTRLSPELLNNGDPAEVLIKHYIERAVTGEALVFEWQFIGNKNNCVTCEVRLVRLPSDDSILLRGSVTDISERKLNESKMRMLSTALQQTADAVVITDSHGIIEYTNAAFERLTGYQHDEVVGHQPDFLGAGEHGSHFYKTLWTTIKSGDVFSDILVNRRKDGVLFYEEKTITPLKNGVGEITHFISTGRDITDRIEAQERLRHLAHHDALTQLPNRAMMIDKLEQAMMHRAKREASRVAILFIDLDHFKMINDTLGHDAGDEAIKSAARLLSACLRASDTVVRFGGDEFVVLLEEIQTQGEVTKLVKKVLTALSEPISIQGHELFISASVGVALCPDDGDDVNTLLKHADIAMYRAKERGRNRYEFYSSEMGVKAYERLTFETKLRNAVKQAALEVYYQPQLDINTGQLMGVEALLRWFPDSEGKSGVGISPREFVPVLEETGLILEVGEWVLNVACDQLLQMQSLSPLPLCMSVNLSSLQFRDAGLDRKIEQMIYERALNPALLELEITESLLMDQHQLVHEILNRIHEMGVKLSLDDFGTGYSSLSYLKKFPIDTLKIDRSFVRDICDDPDDRAIITAIIAMARSLKLNIIAEGVETEAQLDFLKSQCCHAAQGFYFSEALSADVLALFLAKNLND